VSYAQFITWLDGSPLSQLFKVTAWFVPTVQSIHILGIGVVMSAGVIIALRLLGVGVRNVDIVALNERLLPPVWWALVVLLTSGALLIITEPTRTLTNPYFFAKMACLLLLAPLTRYFQLAVRKQPLRWRAASAPTFAVKPMAVGATLLLIAIIFLGRWIAYA
jgi:hypothetical protein